ncbi:MAG: hypothetical protein P8103_06770 [Candidatus Thiodiazotropha sp.]
MSQVDQFESVFRAAVKEVFEYRRIDIANVLIVTDLEAEQARSFKDVVAGFLRFPVADTERQFFVISGDEYKTTSDLLELLASYSPDLICTYRNLHSDAWRFPHSLGEHLDVILQKIDIPVMVLPHPAADYQSEHALQDTTDVMVVTDMHAANDNLINYAAAFTDPAGNLYLTHVEDVRIFERYMDAISKIDVIDTELARKRLGEQLLKEPDDYFHSCAAILQQHHPEMRVNSLVIFSELVAEYRRQIASRKLDLLVLSAKDERQYAMHGVAYPLTVELRHIPLLLI